MDKDKQQTQRDASLHNVAPFPTRDSAKLPDIKERAAGWLVRINSGEFSAEEELALAQWMAADELHRDTLFKLAKQWDSMAILSDLGALFPLSNTALQGSARHAPSTENSDKGWWGGFAHALSHYAFSRFFQSAVALSLVCVLSIVFSPAMQNIVFGVGAPNYVTAIGERSTFTLNDGTAVTLNTNSELAVDFSEGRRDIRLRRGEASFDVAKNPDRPFVVHAGDGMVWAVGTAFSVRYSTAEGRLDRLAVDVVVTEGAVKVFTDIAKVSDTKLSVDASELQRANQAAEANVIGGGGAGRAIEPLLGDERESLLTVGQSLRYTEVINAREQIPSTEIDKQLAWHRGVIIFDGETLEQALLEVSRYTDKDLRIVDPSIRNIPVGGHYKTNNIDALLASLSEGFGIVVKQVDGNRVHLSAKP